MINRYIPYGYCVHGAQIMVNDTEAAVIKAMFRKYISGASLKTLAQELTQSGTEYLPGKSNWDESRVYRLLRCEKYAGRCDFPPIISEEQYQTALETCGARSQQDKSRNSFQTVTEAAAPILCGVCGQPAGRRRSRGKKIRSKYVCGNPDCAMEYHITDEKLTGLILDLMRCASIQTPPLGKNTIEIRKAENEIDRLLDTPDADPKDIRRRIFDLAAEKYRLLTAGLAIADKLRTDLAPANLSSSNIRKTVMETVKRITLIDDKSIQITLINDQVLGEAQTNATDTAAEISTGDSTHHSNRASTEIA